MRITLSPPVLPSVHLVDALTDSPLRLTEVTEDGVQFVLSILLSDLIADGHAPSVSVFRAPSRGFIGFILDKLGMPDGDIHCTLSCKACKEKFTDVNVSEYNRSGFVPSFLSFPCNAVHGTDGEIATMQSVVEKYGRPGTISFMDNAFSA